MGRATFVPALFGLTVPRINSTSGEGAQMSTVKPCIALSKSVAYRKATQGEQDLVFMHQIVPSIYYFMASQKFVGTGVCFGRVKLRSERRSP
jgi:hypothetical protein